MICQPCREMHDPGACMYPVSCTCQHRERGTLVNFPLQPVEPIEVPDDVSSLA